MKQPLLINLLFTLFVGLKLSDQIEWSWWLVFAPLWGYALVMLGAGFVVGYRAVRKAHCDKALDKSITEKPHPTPSHSLSQRKH